MIHLWLIVVMATCYSVFIVWWLRTKVLCTRDTVAAFVGMCRLTPLAMLGGDLSNLWCADKASLILRTIRSRLSSNL